MCVVDRKAIAHGNDRVNLISLGLCQREESVVMTKVAATIAAIRAGESGLGSDLPRSRRGGPLVFLRRRGGC